MRIDVVGAGAIGLLYGGRLAEAGAEVTVWTRTMAQAEMIAGSGIRLRDLGERNERIVPLKSGWIGQASALENAETASEQGGAYRWIWLTVKQTDINDELLAALKIMTSGSERTAVVCLQNGIGHLERIKEELPAIPLFAAVTTEGAKRLDMRSVDHTGRGQLWLGEWKGEPLFPEAWHDLSQQLLISMLQTAGFSSTLSNELNNRIFNKLLINAVINPLTAIFDVENGDLPNHPTRETLMRSLYAETERVLVTAGMNAPEDGWRLILDVCRQTSRNISSMLSDVRAGRITEIDAINGGVVRLAKRHGLQAPLNQAIAELVQALHPKQK
ncbi:ketopantoate reductase family protein [Paenibacillus paridis]|uniref:ketopantoate reductase family protein n=1 Tax=Paenibacillus paridis TaxID=2583376 RepID=UPI0013920DCD|nr:2-dehydropantoate 2-reductase [Paenibacillus paridis]